LKRKNPKASAAESRLPISESQPTTTNANGIQKGHERVKKIYRQEEIPFPFPIVFLASAEDLGRKTPPLNPESHADSRLLRGRFRRDPIGNHTLKAGKRENSKIQN